MTLAQWLGFDSPIERSALVLMHSLWQALLVVNLVAVILAQVKSSADLLIGG